MSLRDALAAIAAASEQKIPAETRAVMRRATEDLRASGVLDHVKKAGDRAPDFALPNEEGQTVRLADLLARGPVALTFYRGVWCPYCNADLKALQDIQSRIEAAGASLVAVSPQNQANSRKAKRDHALTFPILGDDGNRTADAYGLKFALSADLKRIYQGFGLDLPAFNGDATWTLPMPARFLIRPDGIIVSAEADPDYTTRPEPERLLAALDDMRTRAL